jgi:hypothetical protein
LNEFAKVFADLTGLPQSCDHVIPLVQGDEIEKQVSDMLFEGVAAPRLHRPRHPEDQNLPDRTLGAFCVAHAGGLACPSTEEGWDVVRRVVGVFKVIARVLVDTGASRSNKSMIPIFFRSFLFLRSLPFCVLCFIRFSFFSLLHGVSPYSSATFGCKTEILCSAG